MALPRKADAGEIALLLAIPLNEEEFISQVGNSDWLRKYAAAGFDTTDPRQRLATVWANEYGPLVAAPFCELIATALELGIEVRTGATLTALREATTRKSIVILVAHWKGAEILVDDFVGNVEKQAFVERVREADTSLARWLAVNFRANGFLRAEPDDGSLVKPFRPWKSRRVRTLTEILRMSLGVAFRESLATDGIDEVIENDATRSARRRDALDQLFDGLLRPGNRLELCDGLHSREHVEAAVAQCFQGVLDLTICTSTILADFISSRRQLRFRVVQFPTVQEPLWAAKCLKATLELTLRANLAFLDARVTAQRELERAVAEVYPPKRFMDRLRIWG